MSIEALKKIASIENKDFGGDWDEIEEARQIARQAIAIEESSAIQEPVAWLITDEAINSIQVASIQRLIDRLKHAHHTDLCVRINGQDEWYEADWIKHLKRVHPQPKRKWVGLTDEDMTECIVVICNTDDGTGDTRDLIRAVEAKLKEKNT